jgi:hypothetical protein
MGKTTIGSEALAEEIRSDGDAEVLEEGLVLDYITQR